MNERYLYRAKRTDNGEWIIGFYHWTNWRNPQTLDIVDVTHSILPINCQDSYYVDPSTICQCTGLRDKNGKLIWENDIVRHEDLTNGRYIARKQPMKNSVIKWNCKEVKFERSDRRDIYRPESRLEVIGNIFDNSELLEVGE